MFRSMEQSRNFWQWFELSIGNTSSNVHASDIKAHSGGGRRQMESLHIDGQSIKFVDRKQSAVKRDSFDDGIKLSFERKLFTPLSVAEATQRRAIKKKCPREIAGDEACSRNKRRILKRPKRFKNYYSDRQPLAIPSFSFPRWPAN